MEKICRKDPAIGNSVEKIFLLGGGADGVVFGCLTPEGEVGKPLKVDSY